LQLGNLGLYFHTLRYLRPSQLVARAWHELRHPSPDARTAPRARSPVTEFIEACPTARNLLDEQRFEALGESHGIAGAEVWNDTGRSALWVYNLHYFDDLNAADAAQRREWHRRLLRRWVNENPAGVGIGWHSYPVARRIINWVKWAGREPEAAREFHDSLALQARWLMQRLEFHLGGNHLLANAKALLFAGCHFDGPEAARWLRRGMSIMSREIDEQVLEDGGHFERSPMYHAAVLEDVLDSINILRRFGIEAPVPWSAAAARMLPWLDALTHPDGGVSFFNDSALDIAPSHDALAAYARRLGISPVGADAVLAVLGPSGYLRARCGAAWLACDCAPVGPDYLPGHAHADTLSFELSLGSQRLLVNSGTSLYGTSDERNRQRGTAAHNTVTVDDQDSSEVWAGFRVARRARARMLNATSSSQGVSIQGSHDGYRRLPGGNIHARLWQLGNGSLLIRDQVSGGFRRAVAHFHFHPEISVERRTPHALGLSGPGSIAARLEFAGARVVELGRGSWHPRFGTSIPNSTVRVEFAAAELQSRLTWEQPA
jgi:uncharacterized heparinase superfamily protein